MANLRSLAAFACVFCTFALLRRQPLLLRCPLHAPSEVLFQKPRSRYVQNGRAQSLALDGCLRFLRGVISTTITSPLARCLEPQRCQFWAEDYSPIVSGRDRCPTACGAQLGPLRPGPTSGERLSVRAPIRLILPDPTDLRGVAVTAGPSRSQVRQRRAQVQLVALGRSKSPTQTVARIRR